MSSKLSKSTIVAGAGVLSTIFINLVRKVDEMGGELEDIHFLATPEGDSLLKTFAKMIVAAGKAGKVFPLVVDYDCSLAEMIRMGKYDQSNRDINEHNFPVSGEGKKGIEIRFFRPRDVVSDTEVSSETERLSCRPATLPELLALGAAYPELQRQFRIISLDSFWLSPGGSKLVPCLGEEEGRRILALCWNGSIWCTADRFAIVPIIP